ncbi:MAG: Trk system potassium transporter TrkA [Lachnospira sp.]|nr:Trk system potassium transporter TrkA [Lachnospira sp.]
MKKQNVVKVCIVGAGKIGCSLIEQLAGSGCEVTAIDKELAVINRVSTTYDVICYQGNGASYDILEEVGVKECDIFIAVTGSDEFNILSCLTAHKLGAKNTIARVRNVDYAMKSDFYRKVFGLSMTINPELVTASEIQRLLRFPAATRVELFAKGRAELVEMKVEPDNNIVGKSLLEFNRNMKINLLICAIVRDGNIIIPKGETIINEGDVLYITGAPREFRDSFKKMNIKFKPINSAMILGGSRIAYYLAKMLESNGIKVSLIEKNHDVAVELAEALPGVSVMHSDAMEYFASMSDSDIKNTDSCIALTNNDEYNMISSMYAKSKNIPKVITKMNSNSSLKVLKKDDIAYVSKENASTDIIVGYARSLMAAENMDSIESMYRLMDGKLEFVEFAVHTEDDFIDKPLKSLKLKKRLLIACIIRNRQAIIPRGDDVIKNGDSVLVVTIDNHIARLQDIFES